MKTVFVVLLCCAVSAAIAYAQGYSAAYYSVVTAGDGRVAWRMHTGGGDISACYFEGSKAPLTCTPWTK